MKQNRMKRNSKQGEESGEKDFGSAVRKGYLSESVVLLFEQRLSSWEGANPRRCVGRAFRSEAQNVQRHEGGSNFACFTSSLKVIASGSS